MDIAVFAACHRQCGLPLLPFLRVVQAGTALSGERFPDMEHDDEGENISALNPYYCELTVLYYAWKNVKCDWYGLCHYRRFLSFAPSDKTAVTAKRPDSESFARRFGYTSQNILSLTEHCDIILPTAEECFCDCRTQFKKSKMHCGVDLAAVEDVIKRLTPEYAFAANKYLSGTRQYLCNMFLMRKELLTQYCEWLFPVLAEVDRVIGLQKRLDGYIAERMLGIFVTQKLLEGAKVLEFPRIIIPRNGEERIGYALLPAGTKRKAFFKKLTER